MALSLLRDAIERSPSLSRDERSLLETSCRALCGSDTDRWRVVAVEGEGEGRGRAKASKIADSCQEVLSLVDNVLLPSVRETDTELRAFYLKLKASCIFFQYEVTEDKELLKRVSEVQKSASEVSQKLPKSHPIRLSITLQRYKFHKLTHRTYEMFKAAFDDAIVSLDSLAEDSYKDSTLLMQELRDKMNEYKKRGRIEKEEEVGKMTGAERSKKIVASTMADRYVYV